MSQGRCGFHRGGCTSRVQERKPLAAPCGASAASALPVQSLSGLCRGVHRPGPGLPPGSASCEHKTLALSQRGSHLSLEAGAACSLGSWPQFRDSHLSSSDVEKAEATLGALLGQVESRRGRAGRAGRGWEPLQREISSQAWQPLPAGHLQLSQDSERQVRMSEWRLCPMQSCSALGHQCHLAAIPGLLTSLCLQARWLVPVTAWREELVPCWSHEQQQIGRLYDALWSSDPGH